MKKLFLLGSLLAIHWTVPAQDLTYQMPPKAIVDLVDAPVTPRVSIAADGKWLLLLDVQDLPSIADLSQPELRMAGLRLNPRTNGPSRVSYSTSLKLKRLAGGAEIPVKGLPTPAKISEVSWSPDDSKVAFALTTEATAAAGGQIQLWVLDVATATARQIPGVRLNSVFGTAYRWLPDNQTLIARTVPTNRGPVPDATAAPTGPIVQENVGRTAAARTYQDLLKNPGDEKLFDYYATTQLMKVSLDGKTQPLGQPGVIQQATPSPDGKYILVETRHRPYSYQLTVGSFPVKVDVLDLAGNLVKSIADLPLADNVPTSFDAVPTGPRSHDWRDDAPATIYWVEAQDGGDPKKIAAVRDKVLTLAAPFAAAPQELVDLPLRFRGITWGNNTTALVNGYRWADRKVMTWVVNPTTKMPPTVLFDRSSQDTYNDPGTPYQKPNAAGRDVLALGGPDQQTIYLLGDGASPEGNRPFVDQLNLKTRKTERWWRSEAPYYEVPVAILDTDKRLLVTRRESVEQAPNYFLRDAKKKNKLTALTSFPNPYPALGALKKQVLQYKRADGLPLTANLYLPPNYKKTDGPLPTLLEAYPAEYKDKSTAGQVKGSPYTFTRLTWGSPIFWVTQGYAVLQNTSIPIVGEGTAEPNDTYLEQLVAGAKAAIEEGQRLGVVDPKRVGVMGHSYGAFMTANLLAHSNLFKAGIARSGAYNRTLTPFGFQAEERTYWEAPQVYDKMSPFTAANKIKTPILLIHGEADNNSGTFPIQSERFYNALKGHGATARYVVLPFESHGYAARESIMHMLWEMDSWLNKYVKETPPAPVN
ncbi:glutamyl peptidase. Serine peptidase. MEROPS family S09D [Hymenobacter roseosalivarius DSM 11622]|uniref:Glutamyl peptidase. Serine peptidase. MEROPS family S09D n=1 Tax=Hymenobacter roseosalivarius DSM 11622 TaxID=645990 RepID=A0A1W1V3W0_9BACT|nr:prolyl oligopeptidase family serine peptidase [Hymenobacter roseosalivarius]SMB87976.1 glutamyl peptidase. Serine peptidase. MEROPS family S09D [Hymenobacter roseosalivarius DSM 11622]